MNFIWLNGEKNHKRIQETLFKSNCHDFGSVIWLDQINPVSLTDVSTETLEEMPKVGSGVFQSTYWFCTWVDMLSGDQKPLKCSDQSGGLAKGWSL